MPPLFLTGFSRLFILLRIESLTHILNQDNLNLRQKEKISRTANATVHLINNMQFELNDPENPRNWPRWKKLVVSTFPLFGALWM